MVEVEAKNASAEYWDRTRSHASEFEAFADQVSRRLSVDHRVYPMGTEALHPTPAGLEPYGYRRRYVGRMLGGARTFFSIGVRDPFASSLTPIWMRFHCDTPNFALVRRRLQVSTEWKHKLEDGRKHMWIPLDIPDKVGHPDIVAALVKQAESVIAVVYG